LLRLPVRGGRCGDGAREVEEGRAEKIDEEGKERERREEGEEEEEEGGGEGQFDWFWR
jgi:hypothetical protein